MGVYYRIQRVYKFYMAVYKVYMGVCKLHMGVYKVCIRCMWAVYKVLSVCKCI